MSQTLLPTMPSKKHKPKKSPITNTRPPPPPPPYRSQQQRPWTEFLSNNIAAAHNLWRTNRSSAPAVTKSLLPPPPTSRCDAHHNQPPQLRHVAVAAPTQNPPYPSPPPPRYRYLHDSTTLVEVAAKTPKDLHWRVLSHGPTARARTRPVNPYNPIGPVLYLDCVVGPNGPTSGLTVIHTVSRTVLHDVYRDTNVSVWYECNTPDPFDSKKKKIEFVSMVSFHGNYYAMSLQGAIAVMQVVDTRLQIMALGPTRAVPRSSLRFFTEYLFEMNGEILLVFLIHRESLAVVDHVEVFRLDLARLDWIKVERLRGKTLFLNERCVWVDSEEFGCGDDRVYFVEGLENNWKVFDMKNCCISPVAYG